MNYPKIRIIEESAPPPEVPTVIKVRKNQLIDLKDFQLQIRSIESILGGKSFFLPSIVDSYSVEWIIVRDNYGATCLIPLKEK